MLEDKILKKVEFYKLNSRKKLYNLFIKYPHIVGKYIRVYTVLTTCPIHRSGNVGDLMITESCIKLIRHLCERGEPILFYTLFRRENLNNHLNIINNTRGIILPGFAIRENMYNRVYRLTDNLDDITVPFIPIGAGECTTSGRIDEIIKKKYNDQTINFLKYVCDHSPPYATVTACIGCRDPLVKKQLVTNGVIKCKMVGDCVWYDIDMLGKPLKYDGTIKKVVFTEPHSSIYIKQGFEIIKTICYLFPNATKIYSQHSKENSTIKKFEKFAKESGFEIYKCSHDSKKLEFYKECDLHIGYRLHGYIAFLRNRIPAILFMEDGRGIGMSQGLKSVGCLPAFIDSSLINNPEQSNERVPDMELSRKLEDCIKHHLGNDFKDYNEVIEIIDKTYKASMKPFILRNIV